MTGQRFAAHIRSVRYHCIEGRPRPPERLPYFSMTASNWSPRAASPVNERVRTSRGAMPSMMTASCQRKAGAPADPAALPGVFRHGGRVVSALLTAAALSVSAPDETQAQERPAAPMEARVQALIPELEAYIQNGMKAFDVPGVAVGIVTGD